MTGWGNGDCGKKIDKDINDPGFQTGLPGRFGWWKNHRRMRMSNWSPQQGNASPGYRFFNRGMGRGFRGGFFRD
jgi:hypothetical protein